MNENQFREKLSGLSKNEIIDLIVNFVDDGEWKKWLKSHYDMETRRKQSLYLDALKKADEAKLEMELAESDYRTFNEKTAKEHCCYKNGTIDYMLMYALMDENEREMEKSFRDRYTKAARVYKMRKVVLANRRKSCERK